jgi:hypothetical protein
MEGELRDERQREGSYPVTRTVPTAIVIVVGELEKRRLESLR